MTSSASEVTTLRRYTNLFIIIIINKVKYSNISPLKRRQLYTVFLNSYEQQKPRSAWVNLITVYQHVFSLIHGLLCLCS